MKKKRAITDLNVPNGHGDIPSQTQEFEQDGRLHFVGFQPLFHVNMTSQTQRQNNEKLKVQNLRSLSFDSFEILQAIRTQ